MNQTRSRGHELPCPSRAAPGKPEPHSMRGRHASVCRSVALYTRLGHPAPGSAHSVGTEQVRQGHVAQQQWGRPGRGGKRHSSECLLSGLFSSESGTTLPRPQEPPRRVGPWCGRTTEAVTLWGREVVCAYKEQVPGPEQRVGPEECPALPSAHSSPRLRQTRCAAEFSSPWLWGLGQARKSVGPPCPLQL